MLNGRDALGEIDQAIEVARRESAALKAGLAGLNEREVEMRGQMRAALEELARFRLERSRAGEVADAVAGIDREVAGLMAAREREREALDDEIGTIGEEISGLDARRADAAAAAERAAGALDEGESALQRALENDAGYQEQFGRTESAEKVATEAEHKHALAEEDRRRKGAPYEADTLFMYLWNRGFGTPAYRGSGLVRTGDQWVAGLIRFEGARRNYHMLTEIPQRLGEHAARMRAAAEAEIDALAALEGAAREKTDLPQRERALADAQGEVGKTDALIAAARERTRDREARLNAFGHGEDPKYRAAIEVMVAALDQDSIAELRLAARATRMPEDDEIVARLVALEDGLVELTRERDDLRDHARAKADRLIELEDMRVEFRKRRYDDYGSHFTDGTLFGVILAEFVRGAISGSVYWDRLARGHRRTTRHSRPDFGSGRFRFPGPLSFPGSSRSGGGFRSGGGLSRGGFKTGGGF